jgi:hypothetical protein
MGVLLQAFYNSVRIPGLDSSIRWWWDHLASQAARLGTAGFSAVWLPPILKAASGTLSMGYDPFDDYDIGSKEQKAPCQRAMDSANNCRAASRRCVQMASMCISIWSTIIAVATENLNALESI